MKKSKRRDKEAFAKIRAYWIALSKTPKGCTVTRSEMLLAILAASNGRPYTPVQMQKATFLVTRNLPHLVDIGQNYVFAPYDYGPYQYRVCSI